MNAVDAVESGAQGLPENMRGDRNDRLSVLLGGANHDQLADFDDLLDSVGISPVKPATFSPGRIKGLRQQVLDRYQVLGYFDDKKK